MIERRLSGLDTACLAIENATAPLHTVAVLALDASAGAAVDPADTLIHAVQAMVARHDRLRAQLVEAPFSLVAPTLTDGGAPDLEQHLSRVRAPNPGGPRELGRLVDDVLSRPLPRGCPLWEMTLVEGLASGSTGLIVKLHCVPLDGTTAWQLGMALVRERGEQARLWSPGAGPLGREENARDHEEDEGWSQLVTRSARWARVTTGLVGQALRSLGDGARDRAPRPDPPTGSRLNTPTPGGRRAAFATFRAATVDTVAKVFAVSPAAVVLAALAGTLRVQLAAAGQPQLRPLVAGVLREIAAGDGHTAALPRVSLERLPTHVALPGARLRMVYREETLAPRLLPEPWTALLDEWAQATAPVVFSLAARLSRDLDLAARLSPVANLLVTFAADAPEQPRVEGLRVEHVHPFGPLPEGINLHLAVQRIGGALDVGITAAGDVLPDPWRFAADLGDALRELHEAALALDSQ